MRARDKMSDGLVRKVPAEVYLAYEATAREIASRAQTESATAVKNAILVAMIRCRLAGEAAPTSAEPQ